MMLTCSFDFNDKILIKKGISKIGIGKQLHIDFIITIKSLIYWLKLNRILKNSKSQILKAKPINRPSNFTVFKIGPMNFILIEFGLLTFNFASYKLLTKEFIVWVESLKLTKLKFVGLTINEIENWRAYN